MVFIQSRGRACKGHVGFNPVVNAWVRGPFPQNPRFFSLPPDSRSACVRAVRRPESHGVFCVKEGQRCRHNCRGLKNTTVVGTSSAFSAPSPPLPPPRPSTSTAQERWPSPGTTARVRRFAPSASIPSQPPPFPGQKLGLGRRGSRSPAGGSSAAKTGAEAKAGPPAEGAPAPPLWRLMAAPGRYRGKGRAGGPALSAARSSLPPVRPSLRLAAGGCRGRVGSGLPRLLSGGWRPPMRGSLNPLPVRRVFRVVKPTDRRARPDPRSSSRRRRSHSLVRSVPAPARVRVFASPHRPSPLRHYQDSFNAAFPAPVSPPMTKYRRRPGGDHRPLPPEHPGSAKGPTSSRCLLDPLSPEGRCSPGGFRAGMAAGLS